MAYLDPDVIAVLLHVPVHILYAFSNSSYKHYRLISIPKKNGKTRQLTVPDNDLKIIQRSIYFRFLRGREVSPAAKAYLKKGTTTENAKPHVGKPMILKLDIRHFFDNVLFWHVKEKVFTSDIYSENARVLMTYLCTYDGHLAQGAPSSPAITNILMKDFDDEILRFCGKDGVCYTRYCDDMTFSGVFEPDQVISKVAWELKKMGLHLNPAKTRVIWQGQQMNVTGLVVNDKVSVPASYRRKIRQEIHYIWKYSVEDHLKHMGREEDEQYSYLSNLLGRINYVLSIHKDDFEFQEYKDYVVMGCDGRLRYKERPYQIGIDELLG
ncbi:MAG: RNA-directed DNA polymerase [Clostridiales bacterium]|nr:RNA-directed DNA polymerase [Clostridiales bacterium]